MATEDQIKELAHTIWEQEGRPEGKDMEHYFHAKKVLEQEEAAHAIELAPSPPIAELAPPPPTVQSGKAQPTKRSRSAGRKQR